MPRAGRAGGRGDVAAAARELVSWDARDRLFAEIRRRPVRSLAMALGAGYLAGGGIGTILTARLLAVGARIALRLAVLPVLADGMEQVLFPSREADGNQMPGRQSKQSNEKEIHS